MNCEELSKKTLALSGESVAVLEAMLKEIMEQVVQHHAKKTEPA